MLKMKLLYFSAVCEHSAFCFPAAVLFLLYVFSKEVISIDHFAYVLQRPKNQVYIGTAADIRSRFGSQEPVYFCSEDELLNSLNSFRNEELIITTVSDLPIFNKNGTRKTIIIYKCT
ncbi:hypothetical protein CHL76_08975 [Marinococcus halophilus]|nr:hypothetical protein CHL76_08975 [Marinococcus halophilus]